MHSYEVEIKVLLGEKERKDIFLEKVEQEYPTLTLKRAESQRNHYFEGWSPADLLTQFEKYLSDEKKNSLSRLIHDATSFSVRTRGTDTQTILVVKATMNAETSANGTQRIEWEADLFPMSLDTMDTLVQESWFSYQAKWSRDRESYALDPHTHLDVDKNAGYGYIAEFEKVIEDEGGIDSAREEILAIIESLGYEELNQERLARMFNFYNTNWGEYYGTEKVFVIE